MTLPRFTIGNRFTGQPMLPGCDFVPDVIVAGLSEQLEHVVREVDVAAFEALVVDCLTRPQPPAVGAPLPPI